MKLEDPFAEHKLGLDMTPLIDVVFLLVLFFAVSTSFISPRALEDLKDNVLGLEQANVGLDRELRSQVDAVARLESDLAGSIAEREATVAELSRSLAQAATRRAEMEWQIRALEGREEGLRATLADNEARNQTLAEQLAQAYRDFEGVRLELDVERTTGARRAAENEALLARIAAQIERSNALSTELAGLGDAATRLRAEVAERDARQRLLDALIADKAAEIASLQGEVQASAEERARVEAALAAARDDGERQAADQALLRNLLAERAAENESLARRIAALDQQRQALDAQLAGAREDSAAMTARLADYAARLDELAGAADGYRRQLDAQAPELERLQRLASLDAAQVERLLQAQALLERELGDYLQANRLGIARDRDRLTLRLSDQILFDSGSAVIKTGGLELLREVGEIVGPRLGELELRVGGHTDNVPVSAGTGALYPDNWSLSAARAVNVVAFLEQDVGLDPARMSAVGHGEHRPVADNASAAGRAQNRRIEIVLVPR